MSSFNLGGILADKDKSKYSGIILRSVTFFRTPVMRRQQLTIWAKSQIYLERTYLYISWRKAYLSQGNISVLR